MDTAKNIFPGGPIPVTTGAGGQNLMVFTSFSGEPGGQGMST